MTDQGAGRRCGAGDIEERRICCARADRKHAHAACPDLFREACYIDGAWRPVSGASIIWPFPM